MEHASPYMPIKISVQAQKIAKITGLGTDMGSLYLGPDISAVGMADA